MAKRLEATNFRTTNALLACQIEPGFLKKLGHGQIPQVPHFITKMPPLRRVCGEFVVGPRRLVKRVPRILVMLSE